MSHRWEGSARVKIGEALDRWMPYATAGVSVAQATLFTHRDYGIDGIHDFSADANLIGITVGGVWHCGH